MARVESFSRLWLGIHELKFHTAPPTVSTVRLRPLPTNLASSLAVRAQIYGGAMLLAMVWYAIDARKWFKGPRINIEHREHPVLTANDTQESEDGSQPGLKKE